MTATLPLAQSLVAPMPSEFSRTDAAGGSPSSGAHDGDLQLVTCFVGGEEYGLEISRVREIMRVGRITEIPKAPAHVRGVINLRGRIVAILDLRKRLGLPEAEVTGLARIIVVESGLRLLGLLVDRVSQVVRLAAATVEAPPQEAEGARAFVKGLGKKEKGVVLILDLDHALRRDFENETASIAAGGESEGREH